MEFLFPLCTAITASAHQPPPTSRPQMDTSDNLWLDFFISNISIHDTSDVTAADVCSHVAWRHDQCMERCRINIVSACPHPHSLVVVRGGPCTHPGWGKIMDSSPFIVRPFMLAICIQISSRNILASQSQSSGRRAASVQ